MDSASQFLAGADLREEKMLLQTEHDLVLTALLVLPGLASSCIYFVGVDADVAVGSTRTSLVHDTED